MLSGCGTTTIIYAPLPLVKEHKKIPSIRVRGDKNAYKIIKKLRLVEESKLRFEKDWNKFVINYCKEHDCKPIPPKM